MHMVVFRSSAVCIAFCAAGLAVVGALLNWKGAAMMAPGDGAFLMSCGAALAEPLKLVWLSGWREAKRLGARDVALGVLVMGVFLHVFSMTSAIGLAGASRIVASADLSGQQNKAGRAHKAYDDAQSRIERLRGQREPAIVDRELAQARADLQDAEQRVAKELTTGCGRNCEKAKADAKVARGRIDQLEPELALSCQADEARRDLGKARTDLDAITAPVSTDPQADALASFMPLLSSRTVGKALPLLPSLLVEFTPPVAMLLAVLLWQVGGGPQRRGLAAPVPTEMHAQQEALDRVRAIVLNSPNARLVPSINALADALGIARSTFHEWVDKWQQAGHIKATSSGKQTLIELCRRAA